MPSLARAAGERTLVLPTGEPAGTVATRTAGVAEFGTTLLWDRAEDAPPGPTLPTLPGRVRCSVVETDAPGEARREVLGEVLALTPRDLGQALETVLRSLTATAALSGAVLETRVVRVAHPEAPPSGVVQALALDLWNAGFPVRFGPSWTPSPHGAVAVGFRGDEAELRRFFGAHPSWEMA
jgi:hypothetical protein